MGFFLMTTTALTACSNGNKGNNTANHVDNNGYRKQNAGYNTIYNNTARNQNGSQVDLRNYSKDPDINTGSEDFDVIGKYVKENSSVIVLNIDGRNIYIKKAPGFRKDLKGFKGGLKDREVDVEVTHNNQLAKSLEPAPMTLADQDGVYEHKTGGDVKVIGKLIAIDKTHVSIQVPNGIKTYAKTSDFKVHTDGRGVHLKGKMVRIKVNKKGKVKELKYNWIDQR